MSASLSSTPISVVASEAELKNGLLGQRNLELAVRAIVRDGLVVLENMVDHATLDKLNVKMVEDAYTLQASKNSPYNYNKGNIQQDPPVTKEWFSEEIFTHPIITQLTSTVLGARPSLGFISGNTALPPTQDSPPASQPTHNDADFDHPSIPFAMVVNVPLVTMEVENGSTEIWLGTHDGTTLADQEGAHGDRASGRIKKTLLEARREVRPPSQPLVKKGSIIVRDLRLWHGGKPNMSDKPRVMLAMIHFASWYRNQMKVEIADELQGQLDPRRTGLQIAATYVPSEQLLKNYLVRPYGNAYDFDQVDKIDGIF